MSEVVRLEPRRSLHKLAVGVVVLAGVFARAWNLDGYPQFSDDEGTYVAQAWAVQHGLGLAHYTYTYDHPPLGWMQISALSWLPQELFPALSAVASGRMVMLIFAALAIWLLYVLGRRLQFSHLAAVAAATIYAASPMAISLQRQVFLDNVALTWMLAAMVLVLSPRRHLWSYVGAGVFAAAAVLSKETLLLAIPALLYALWHNADPKIRSFALIGSLCGLLTTLGFYPLYAALNGELLGTGPERVSMAGAWWNQLVGRQGSGSVFGVGSDANATVYGWYLLDAQLLVLGGCGTLIALAVPRLRIPAIAAAVPMLVIVARPDGYLPGMLVIQLMPFWILAIVGLLGLAVNGLRGDSRASRLAAVAATLAVMVTCFAFPQWLSGWRTVWNTSVNGPYAQSVSWIQQHIARGSGARIVTDDAIWLDLVELGYDPTRQVIWHFKVDLDSRVHASMPGGWRDADFIVSSSTVRRTATDLPIVASILTHSRPIAVFGAGSERVEIRAVDNTRDSGGR